MKSLVLVSSLLLLGGGVYGRNAWEMSRSDRAAREADLAIREEKRAKTSIIVYDKQQMTADDVAAEITRIEAKCVELECPCDVKNLRRIGVLEVTWNCDNHPSVDELGLDKTKETGAEDQIVEVSQNLPPPTDPKFADQWALQDLANDADINIAEGWEQYLDDEQGGSADGPSVIVAVIDTGVDYTHPDLKDVMWNNPDEIPDDGIDNDGNGIVDDYYGADFTETTSGTGDPIDRNSHGTHCAGIIAASPNNGQGVAGVASFTQGKVKIMALKGLSDEGSGTISGLFACLEYAIEKNAKISSNSWGGGTVNGLEEVWDQVLRNNLDDHLFVAAAGNSNMEINDGYKSMTCGLKEPNLLCVGSSTSSDSRSSFSNYGTDYVHVMAPGSSILSTFPNNDYQSISGTSMACPQVSGLAALLWTMRGDLTGPQVRQLIEANVQVKPQYAAYVSTSGLIDVGATIKALKNGGAPNPEPPKCDYSQYCSVVDCTKEGAAALCPDQCKVCGKIKVRTENWGYENSYAIGTCVSQQEYGYYEDYEEDCCLAPGTYSMDCKCSWGDGWHGGYVEINGVKYCDDFTYGHSQSVEVTW